LRCRGELSGLEYLQNAIGSLLTIAQIETKQAFQNLDAIATVEGIDVLFAGSWDLGNNLGCPVTGEFAPELKSAIATILEVAKVKGKESRDLLWRWRNGEDECRSRL
jgi:4-hydroxy-2-oxoheptanedioate aldolase